jgi:hypothetical protein
MLAMAKLESSTMRNLRLALVPLLLIPAVACGGEILPTIASECVPGRSVTCSSPSGCSGTHVCLADGSGYAPCDCGGDGIDVDAAGPDATYGTDDATSDDAEQAVDAGEEATDASIDAGTFDAGGADSPTDAALDRNMADSSLGGGDAAPSDGSGTSDGGCLSWALGGIGVPPGTLASASTTYSNDVPALAIDGELTTDWNATDYTAWLSLQFPTPQTINGIRLAANSSPPTSEIYTVTSAGSSPTTIGSGTEVINGNSGYTIEPAISVTPGTYAAIIINVNGAGSWVAVNEVSLLTSECP